jgi:hypothetical protein
MAGLEPAFGLFRGAPAHWGFRICASRSYRAQTKGLVDSPQPMTFKRTAPPS